MQMPLFEQPEGVPLQRAKTLRDLDRESRPRWSRYRPRNPVTCDECVIYLHERKGVGPVPRGARWRRVTPDRTLLLCEEHTQMWKRDDAKGTA